MLSGSIEPLASVLLKLDCAAHRILTLYNHPSVPWNNAWINHPHLTWHGGKCGGLLLICDSSSNTTILLFRHEGFVRSMVNAETPSNFQNFHPCLALSEISTSSPSPKWLLPSTSKSRRKRTFRPPLLLLLLLCCSVFQSRFVNFQRKRLQFIPQWGMLLEFILKLTGFWRWDKGFAIGRDVLITIILAPNL